MWTCTKCGAEAEDPTGWSLVQVTGTHYVSGNPVAVAGDTGLLVLNFDKDACRDEWYAQMGITL